MADEKELDNDWIMDVMKQHKDKNFVQRAMNPNIFPQLDLGEGNVGTHLMGYATDEDSGKFVVYPHIIQQKDGSLKKLEPDEALDHAFKTNQFIPFDTEKEAAYFSKNYKNTWSGRNKQPATSSFWAQ
jgi:hypothetical protein